MEMRSSRIADSYTTLDEVTEALLFAGLESSRLIVGIDFTKSNEWRGATSFGGRSLHQIGDELNPYEQAITIIGKTLAVFADGNTIPCYGFGDALTRDKDVFSFYPDGRFCNGFEEVLSRYKEILPQVQLAGPTSFAPIIDKAAAIVEQSGGLYHVLVIVADGQVTRSLGTELGQLSLQEKKTVEAIVEASKYPMSIILVGVGDECWETVEDFYDSIPDRAFNNLQFVNFTEIMSKNENPSRKEAEFALAALKEIPSQYKATIELNILGRKGNASKSFPLPSSINDGPSSSRSMPFHSIEQTMHTSTHEPSTSFGRDNQGMEALNLASLESSNLIVGIDFTKSNEWKGATSFNRRSLHHIGDEPNPYEQAITIIGKTFAGFSENSVIPCFGFGDASTHDQDVFSFYSDGKLCNGYEEVLSRYKKILPHLELAGPTSFAPIIEMATTIVEQSGGRHHVLLIIADGQVTRSVGTGGQQSPQEKKTVEALVEASKFPLSIILVGVGDGPWDTVKDFYDNIPGRAFDNMQVVNFTEIMSKKENRPKKEAEFASAALMKILSQFKATIELDPLGRNGNAYERIPLPPPLSHELSYFTSSDEGTYMSDESSASSLMPSDSTSDDQSTPMSDEPSFSCLMPSDLTSVDQSAPVSSTSESAPSSDFDNQLCPICISDPKDMAFGCGHQTCCDCGKELELCPICRRPITIRIKLY